MSVSIISRTIFSAIIAAIKKSNEYEIRSNLIISFAHISFVIELRMNLSI